MWRTTATNRGSSTPNLGVHFDTARDLHCTHTFTHTADAYTLPSYIWIKSAFCGVHKSLGVFITERRSSAPVPWADAALYKQNECEKRLVFNGKRTEVFVCTICCCLCHAHSKRVPRGVSAYLLCAAEAPLFCFTFICMYSQWCICSMWTCLRNVV